MRDRTETEYHVICYGKMERRLNVNLARRILENMENIEGEKIKN